MKELAPSSAIASSSLIANPSLMNSKRIRARRVMVSNGPASTMKALHFQTTSPGEESSGAEVAIEEATWVKEEEVGVEEEIQEVDAINILIEKSMSSTERQRKEHLKIKKLMCKVKYLSMTYSILGLNQYITGSHQRN
jgi:hypothetical protein